MTHTKILHSLKRMADREVYILTNDLRCADLRHADMYGANLSGADLSGSDLYGANLRHANLSGADLRHADLRHAEMYGANLSGADLRHANLPGSNLRHADLSGSDLYGANLRHADLSGSDLSGAKLRCCGRWSVSFTENKVFVGCMSKPTIEDWEKWFTNSDEEFETKRDTFEFREIYLNFQWACGFFEKWHAPARTVGNS